MGNVIGFFNTVLVGISYIATAVATSLGLVTPARPPEIYKPSNSMFALPMVTPAPLPSLSVIPSDILPATPTINVPIHPPTAPPQQTTADASAVVQAYYTWYLDCVNQHLSGTNTGDTQTDCAFNKTGVLTDNLVNTLKQASRYNPVLCAQNTPETMTFDTAVQMTNTTATVVVHGVFGPSSTNEISVGLENSNNQWKISSITCNL